MKITKLPTMDDIFGEVQKFVDEVYAIKDPLEKDRAKLLKETEILTIPCGNTHHAAVGTIFALLVTTKNPKINELFKTSLEPPFIDIDESKASGETLACVQALLKYIKTVVDVKDRIPPLVVKSKQFADTAKGLPAKAKDEAKKATGLGIMDGIMAIKNTATNSKNMASLPNLMNEFQDLVKCSLDEIIGAVKELNEKKENMQQVVNSCESKMFTHPKDCYLECGDEIEVTLEAKKRWSKDKKLND